MNSDIIDIDTQIIPASVNYDLLEYADNPQARCPVVLLLDTSTSMDGEPIKELRRAVSRFYEELGTSKTVSGSVEICVVSFGYNDVSIERKFEPLREMKSASGIELFAGGMTPMGGAINVALHECDQRENYYRRQGVSAYKPVVVLMTDGGPNDDWYGSVQELGQRARNGKVITVPVGIGPHADMSVLEMVAGPRMPATRLQGLDFKEFFKWLSSSIKNITTGSTLTQNGMAPNYHDWAV